MATQRTFQWTRTLAVLAAVSSGAAQAADGPVELASRTAEFSGALLHIHFHAGWNGFEVRQRGLTVPVGPFYGELPSVFAVGSPSRVAAERAASIGVAQLTLSIVGGAGLVAGLVMTTAAAFRAFGYTPSNSVMVAGLVVLPASLVVVLVGGMLGLWAQGYVSDAIASYNEGVLAEALRWRRDGHGPLPTAEPVF